MTNKFTGALMYAATIHQTQVRKGGNKVPYISHLLQVCATVMENGGDEDTCIAALLHDAIEDQGGMETERKIRTIYGDRVADICLECSDSTTDGEKRDWRERKEEHIAKIATASEEACLVMAADKLHNMTCTYHDLRCRGLSAFGMFRGKREGTLWYFRAVTSALEKKLPLNSLVAAKLALIEWEVRNYVENLTGERYAH